MTTKSVACGLLPKEFDAKYLLMMESVAAGSLTREVVATSLLMTQLVELYFQQPLKLLALMLMTMSVTLPESCRKLMAFVETQLDV